MKKIAVLFLLFGGLITLCAAQTITLKTDLQDTQPKFIKTANGFGGLCLDLMHLIEANSPFTFAYRPEFIPPARLKPDLESGDADVYFGWAYDESVKASMIFAEPMIDLSYVLVARADDPISPKTVEEVKALTDAKILTTPGGPLTAFAADKFGANRIDSSAGTPELNLRKLILGRGRFFLYHDLGVYYTTNTSEFKGKFKILPIDLFKTQFYIVFSKKTDPKVVEDFVAVVKSLKKSGEWDKVTKKYKS